MKSNRSSHLRNYVPRRTPEIMHHPRTISDARRLRIASLLLVCNRLLIVSAAALLLLALFANDYHLMIYGTILVGSSIVLIFAQWIAASHAGCPLCRTAVLSSMGCVKHRKARHVLGSYKLRVALAIMFRAQFRCPYCNEPTAMAVKERLRSSGIRGSDFTGFSRFH
jgi:hypothetical protein